MRVAPMYIVRTIYLKVPVANVEKVKYVSATFFTIKHLKLREKLSLKLPSWRKTQYADHAVNMFVPLLFCVNTAAKEPALGYSLFKHNSAKFDVIRTGTYFLSSMLSQPSF